MPTKPQPKTRQQLIEQRAQELDAIRQMQARHEAERAEREREHNEFAARVAAYHERVDSYVTHSFAQRARDDMNAAQLEALRAEIQQEAFEQVQATATVPTLNQVYEAKAAEERAAAEAAEAERIAAITPKQNWLASLPWPERERVSKYEKIRGMPWPGTENMG